LGSQIPRTSQEGQQKAQTLIPAIPTQARSANTVNDEGTALKLPGGRGFNDLLKKHGKRQGVENPLLD
jgi:hypothetical protein